MARMGYCVHNVELHLPCDYCYFEKHKLEEEINRKQITDLTLVKENFIKLLKEDDAFLIEVKNILGIL
jgi:hypothetical protein